MLTWMFGVLLRAEMRDALVWLGDPMLHPTDHAADRLYVTKSWRVTAGFAPSSRSSWSPRQSTSTTASTAGCRRYRTTCSRRRSSCPTERERNEPHASSHDDRHGGGVSGGRGRASQKARARKRAVRRVGPRPSEFAALKQRVDEQTRAADEDDAARGRALRVSAEAAAQHGTLGDRHRGVRHQEHRRRDPREQRRAPAIRGRRSSRHRRRGPSWRRSPGASTVKGKPWGPIYVYVDNVKEAPVDRSVEIVQKDRSFVPNVLVVQKGTPRRVSQRGSVLAQRVFTIHDASVRPRQLPARRQGRRGQVVRPGRRRGAVQHARARCARTSWSFPTATTSR